jgi:hypothetical protein
MMKVALEGSFTEEQIGSIIERTQEPVLLLVK